MLILLISLPSYKAGILFSKYTKVGKWSIPYSLASASLSILTITMPSLSKSSSIFSNSFKILMSCLSSLSSEIRIRAVFFSLSHSEVPSEQLFLFCAYRTILLDKGRSRLICPKFCWSPLVFRCASFDV